MSNITDDKVRELTDPYKDERCACCGCFLGEISTSTECGCDFELVCNNKNCKSHQYEMNKWAGIDEFAREQGL